MVNPASLFEGKTQRYKLLGASLPTIARELPAQNGEINQARGLPLDGYPVAKAPFPLLLFASGNAIWYIFGHPISLTGSAGQTVAPAPRVGA